MDTGSFGHSRGVRSTSTRIRWSTDLNMILILKLIVLKSHWELYKHDFAGQIFNINQFIGPEIE